MGKVTKLSLQGLVDGISERAKHDPKILDLLKRKRPHLKLDIGCGAKPQAGFIGIDIQPFPGVDVVHDIETYPWPFPNDTFELAMASHVAEHINPAKFGFINWMNEVWRILEPEGRFMISAPYGLSPGFVQDPTHVNPMNENTFIYFDPLHEMGYWKFYKPKPWKIIHCEFQVTGFLEVVLEKRRVDKSYDAEKLKA